MAADRQQGVAAWWRHDCRLNVRELPPETLVCEHCGAHKPSAALGRECKVLDGHTPVDVESLAARDGHKQCEEGAILGEGAPCSCEALNDSAYIRVVLENPSHFGSPPREALDALERLTLAAMES